MKKYYFLILLAMQLFFCTSCKEKVKYVQISNVTGKYTFTNNEAFVVTAFWQVLFTLNQGKENPYIFYVDINGMRHYPGLDGVSLDQIKFGAKNFPLKGDLTTLKDLSALEFINGFCDISGLQWKQQGREIIFTKK